MESFWQMFWAFSWVWIPITAILVGGFTEYLKFKTKQRELGTSTDELEKAVQAMQKQLSEQQAGLIQRLENLETIVTSQVWDHLQEAGPAGAPRNLEAARLQLDDLREEVLREEVLRETVSDQQRAAALARRTRT